MIHDLSVTALVPIKEHSERVAAKNFREFCGRPLFHHVIHTLDHTYAVDEIVVNTDSRRVLAEAPALSDKVRVVERPDRLCGDNLSMNAIIDYDLGHSKADVYLQTHATNPLLTTRTIAAALKDFVEDESCDSLFSVTAFHSRFYFPDGTPANHDPERLLRTQDLDPIYEENSCLYLFTRESFAAHNRRIGDRPRLYRIPRIEAVDIDDEFSFRLAELLALYATPADEA